MNADATVDRRRAVAAFRAPFAPADEVLAPGLLAAAEVDAATDARIDARTRRLIAAIRGRSHNVGGIEDFLREFSLSTKEGLALMVLAEALLRVPDGATADRLIEDKLAAVDWPQHEVRSTTLLVTASASAVVSACLSSPTASPSSAAA